MSRKPKRRKINSKFIENIVSIIFFIFIIAFFVWMIKDFFSVKHPNYEYEFKEYVISPGQRVWDIAEEELKNNPYYEGDEVRQIIYEIELDNKINSNQIQAGQVIKIRVIKKDELSNVTDQSTLDNTSEH